MLIITAFVAALFLVCGVNNVQAHSRHHHRHYRNHHFRHRHHVCFHRIKYHYPKYHFNTYNVQITGGHSNILATASRYLHDFNPTHFRGPWCKAFVNMILRETGHYFNKSFRAIDALKLGPHVSARKGAIAVMRNHVTFVASVQDGYIIGLGGNQTHHRVTYSRYPKSRIIAYVEPVDASFNQ